MGVLSTVTIALAAIAPVFAAPAPQDSPSNIPRVSDVLFSGNGCPGANIASESGDYNEYTVNFRGFSVTSGGIQYTKNCLAQVKASGSVAGWQVALADNEIQGDLHLDSDSSLDYFTTVFYQASAANTKTSSNNQPGPYDGSITLHTPFSGSSLVWSACGDPGTLDINFRPSLQGDGKATFNVKSESWTFVWRRCIL